MTPEDKERQERAEAFEAWRTHPITKQVMEVLGRKAEETKEKWVRASWVNGCCDERLRADLKATAETYKYLIELDAEEMEDILEQPERD